MISTELEKWPKAPAVVGTVLALGVIVGQALLDTPSPIGVRGVALALLLLSVPLIGLPFRDLRRYGNPRSGGAYYATTHLVDRGVYRLVRHPQYLGYILLVLGFGLLRPHLVILGLAVGATVSFCVQALWEERACRYRWTSSYEAYMRRVPRFNLPLGAVRAMRERLTGAGN
jgi:protein-S-isoprenylcysteine O-methyltransferase Ste14